MLCAHKDTYTADKLAVPILRTNILSRQETDAGVAQRKYWLRRYTSFNVSPEY